ncbi:MAG: hypothetical protein V4537_16440 [Pseudomonadota bacterium]
MRRLLGDLWWMEHNIRLRMRVSTWCHRRLPIVGRLVAALIDRALLTTYGLDVTSYTVDVRALAIAHPVGVMLGGNGLYSPGRVSIMSGVKLVGRSPSDPEYLRRHAEHRTFVFGDNVVIGVNSTIVGPIDICDNVIVAPMSLVNRPII